MAKLLKLRRGTTSQHSSFTGAEGEVTVDTDKETLVVHNGSTAGGFPVARADGTGVANFTITGELDAATLDISGNADIDGTLEADAYTVNGTALDTHIAGVTVSNATNAATFTTSANNSANETVYPVFVDGATGAQGAETDTGLTYNPSTGLLTTAAVTTTGNVTVGGNLQVDGTTTTVNSSTMTVTDKNIEIAKGAANDAAADGAGITIDSGDGDKTWNWVDSTDAWTSSEHIHVPDSKKFIAGTGSDLQIYNDGNSRVHNTNNGENLILQSDYMTFRTNQVNENIFLAVPNGAVKLYYNGVNTFMTSANGVKVIGPEGGDAEIQINADEGDDNADYWSIKSDTSGNFKVGNYSTGSWVDGLTIDGSNHVTVSNNLILNTDSYLKIGAGSDLQLVHNGSNSYVDNSTGHLYIRSVTGIDLTNADGSDNYIVCTENGSVKLYYDHSNKLETTTAGVTVSGSVTDDKGDVRKIIRNTKSSAYTLVASDTGKAITISSGGVTVPASVLGESDAVTIINMSGSDQTITQGSGLTIYNTADASTGNRTLAGRGMCTIWFSSATTCYISGSGLS